MGYLYKSIVINGKRISLKKICEGGVAAETAFETSTFTFIKSWLTGQQRFQLSTSGSTGAPKRITVTRDQLVGSAQLTIKRLGLKKKSNILLCIDTQYIGGMMMLVRAFIHDMRIYALEPASIKNFKSFPVPVAFAAFVPIQIQALSKVKGSRIQFNKIQNIIIGGAPLNSHDERFISSCKSRIYATYGMTETLSHIALKQISPKAADQFTTLPEVSITTDSRNCLIIGAPFLKKKIHTNDVVELTSSFSFRWLGRYDHVINTGGIKVIPEQVEKSIQQIMKSRQIKNRFYIKGVPDRRLGEKIVMMMEGKKMTAPKESELLTAIKEKLPPYHAPKKIRYVSRFSEVNAKLKRG